MSAAFFFLPNFAKAIKKITDNEKDNLHFFSVSLAYHFAIYQFVNIILIYFRKKKILFSLCLIQRIKLVHYLCVNV